MPNHVKNPTVATNAKVPAMPIGIAATAAHRPLRTPFFVRPRPMIPRTRPTTLVQHSRLRTKPVIETGSVDGPAGAPPYGLPP